MYLFRLHPILKHSTAYEPSLWTSQDIGSGDFPGRSIRFLVRLNFCKCLKKMSSVKHRIEISYKFMETIMLKLLKLIDMHMPVFKLAISREIFE